jgi:carbon monoxide dehydrogenase subunit G
LTGHDVSLDGQEVKLGSSFHVPAEPATVLEKFLDAPTMLACIPGCTELERPDEAHFRGRLTNEIAHVRFDAAFSVEITELSPPHTVRAVLTGEDARLGSSLKVDASLDVAPAGSGSDVTYAMELAMWGRLGRMGEAIFRRRTVEVEKEFLQTFARACAGEDVTAGASARTTGAHGRQAMVAVPAPPGVLHEPAPLAAGAVSAPAVSALPGVPSPVASTNGSRASTVAPVAPADAAAAAVASLRPISDGAGAPLGRLTGRSIAAVVVGAVAALVVLRRVLLARKAGR